jgi:hypothetical protein
MHSRSVMFASALRRGLDKAIPHEVQALEDRGLLLMIEREIK